MEEQTTKNAFCYFVPFTSLIFNYIKWPKLFDGHQMWIECIIQYIEKDDWMRQYT